MFSTPNLALTIINLTVTVLMNSLLLSSGTASVIIHCSVSVSWLTFLFPEVYWHSRCPKEGWSLEVFTLPTCDFDFLLFNKFLISPHLGDSVHVSVHNLLYDQQDGFCTGDLFFLTVFVVLFYPFRWSLGSRPKPEVFDVFLPIYPGNIFCSGVMSLTHNMEQK